MAQAPYIELEAAKDIIIVALNRFDPDLGARADEMLHDDRRLNIVEVTDREAVMMQCRPAGVTMDDVRANAEMYIPDFAERFGPAFTRQDNPEDYAIIDFEYDGTARSIIWLAHETGHALADDVQRENGHSFRDFSAGEMEEQAYFIQHIVSRYVREHMPETVVAADEHRQDDLGESILKMSFDRAAQFTNAGQTFENAQAQPPAERSTSIQKALDFKSI